MLLGIAGDEESKDRAQRVPEERLVSVEIPRNNPNFRSLVHDPMADPKGFANDKFRYLTRETSNL